MKVHGPGQPPATGVSDADAAKAVSGPESGEKTGASGRAFADKLEASRTAAASADMPAQASGVAVADLAARVQAGHLTSRAAVDQIVERIVASQVGPQAPAGVRERVKAALEDALENDPLLAEKLRHLD